MQKKITLIRWLSKKIKLNNVKSVIISYLKFNIAKVLLLESLVWKQQSLLTKTNVYSICNAIIYRGEC